MSLIGQAADFIKARQVPITTWLKDEDGRYAFVAAIPGRDGHKSQMVVTAKDYLHKQDDERIASFMAQKVVQRAADNDAKILLFVRQSNNQLVFDPDLILEAGQPSGDESKRAKNGEHWLEVPAAWACSLEDFADRRDSPRTEPPADVDDVQDDQAPTGTLEDYA